MEVDGDVGKLAEELCSLGTVDHDVLIRQFQQILGQDLSEESCTFFLDMNNWNLPAALGSFYDLGGSTFSGSGPPPELIHQAELPQMTFVRDVTIGEGESVPPCTRFVKTWRVRNCGHKPWPSGVSLRHIEGQLLSNVNFVAASELESGEEADVSVEMVSPSQRGIYQSRWQMLSPDRIPFGEAIWCIIVVDDMGLLGLTQQLASANCSDKNSTNHRHMSDYLIGGKAATYHKENEENNPFGMGLSFHGQQPSVSKASMTSANALWSKPLDGNLNDENSRQIFSSRNCILETDSFSDPQSPSLSPLTRSAVDGLAGTPPKASTTDLLSSRMAMSDNVAYLKRHAENHSTSSTPTSIHSLDASIQAVRGSPAPQHFTIYDVDPPASPNGSTALYEAVAAALPPMYGGLPSAGRRPTAYWSDRLSDEPTDQPSWRQMNATAPLNIPGVDRVTPEVPPCTPSTPPSIINRCQEDSHLDSVQETLQNSDIQQDMQT